MSVINSPKTDLNLPESVIKPHDLNEKYQVVKVNDMHVVRESQSQTDRRSL